MKRGYKTSEFYVVVATLLVGAVMGFYALSLGHEYLGGTAAIVGALAPHTVGYAIARTNAKKGEKSD